MLAKLPEAEDKPFEIAPDAVEAPVGQVLRDPKHYLPHILHILLHNAVAHGQPGPISASADIAGSYWVLTLINPGQFSHSLLQGEFRDLSSREDLGQRSGSVHIGLAVSRRLLEEVGGKVGLLNDTHAGAQVAVVKLSWPLESNDDAEVGNE